MTDPVIQPDSPGSFFSLPAELRNRVYAHITTNNNTPIDATSKQQRHAKSSTEMNPSRTAHANTCRQPYLESSSLFYTHTIFKLRNAHLPSFVHDIPAPHLQSIQELLLDRRDAHWQDTGSPANPHGLCPLSAFHNLKRLRITGLAEPICWSQQVVELARLIEPVDAEEPFEALIRAVRSLRCLEAVSLSSRVEEDQVRFLLDNAVEMGPWRWSNWTYQIQCIPVERRPDATRHGVEGNILESMLRR